jgi:hypothetical protein
MISLLASILRFTLFAVFTFAFVVLFEHGPEDFVPGAKTEWAKFVGFIQSKTGRSPSA